MPSTYKQSFKQNYTDNVELSIFNCGLQSCERGYTWGPGVRDHYLIHYVVDGKGTYTVNNTVYELRAGDIFLAKPSQLITYSADPLFDLSRRILHPAFPDVHHPDFLPELSA